MPRTGQSAVICEVCKERVSHHGSNKGVTVGHKPGGIPRVVHLYKPSCQKKWKANADAIKATWVTPGVNMTRWPDGLDAWVKEQLAAEWVTGREPVAELFRKARAHPMAAQWKMHDRSFGAFAQGLKSRRYALAIPSPTVDSTPAPLPTMNGNGNGSAHAPKLAPASPEVIEAMIAAVPPLLRVLKEQGKTSTIETIFELVSAIEAPVGAGR